MLDEKYTLIEGEEYRDDLDYGRNYTVIVNENGNKYSFAVRNIFDFGLVINPLYRNGGIAIDVESFINHNYKRDPEMAERYRKEHPTETGWGWSSYNMKTLSWDIWIPMTQEEVDVYKYLLSVIPDKFKNIRL